MSKLIGDHAKLIWVSGFVGLLVGLAIVVFSKFYNMLWMLTVTAVKKYWGITVLMPIIGFTLAYLIIRYLAKTKTMGCGTHQLLEVYHYGGGVISERDTVSKALASAVTIGLGGSAGLEGPSLLLGGGIASAVTRRLNFKPEELKIITLSGAAAGFSAIFKAPFTGILFALEIPYQRDLAKEAFIPATISSLLAYFIAVNMLGVEVLFPLIPALIIPSPLMILHAFAIGLIAAFCGKAFVNAFNALNNLKSRFNTHILIYPFIGGLTVGLIGLFMPQVLGVGYDVIHAMAKGEFYKAAFTFLIALIIFKVLATSITLNFGGSGGLFIPSIYVGATLGVLYAKAVPQALSELVVMAAMAAVVAATNKTLLTSVIFVAETIGPSSIIPALIAAATSYFMSGSSSFYQNIQPLEKLVEKEEAISVLYYLIKERKLKKAAAVKVEEVMTLNPIALIDNMSIHEAINIVKKYGYRVYPVITQDKVLIGYTTVSDLLEIPEEKRYLTVSQALTRVPLTATKDDDLLNVVSGMIKQNVDHVYVVSTPQEMKLIGVIAAADILRKLLEHL